MNYLLRGGGLGGEAVQRVWQRCLAVNMVKANLETACACDFDELPCNVWWQSLTSLVMANIALCAAKFSCNGLLRQTKALADGLYVILMHVLNNSAASPFRQYGRYFDHLTATLIIQR